jgi:hypothetical protein
MAWRDMERKLHFMYLGDGRVEDKKEKNESVWGKEA